MPGSHRKETVLILALSTLKKRNLPNTSPKYTLDFCFMTELHIFPGMVFHTSVLFPKNIQLFGFLSLWALNLSSERLMVPTFNTALSGQRHAITFYNSVTRTVAIHHLELSLSLVAFLLTYQSAFNMRKECHHRGKLTTAARYTHSHNGFSCHGWVGGTTGDLQNGKDGCPVFLHVHE